MELTQTAGGVHAALAYPSPLNGSVRHLEVAPLDLDAEGRFSVRVLDAVDGFAVRFAGVLTGGDLAAEVSLEEPRSGAAFLRGDVVLRER